MPGRVTWLRPLRSPKVEEGATAPSITDAQAFLGGRVLIVLLDSGQLLVDEAGGYRPLNVWATRALHESKARRGQPLDDVIVGPAILLEGDAQWT